MSTRDQVKDSALETEKSQPSGNSAKIAAEKTEEPKSPARDEKNSLRAILLRKL